MEAGPAKNIILEHVCLHKENLQLDVHCTNSLGSIPASAVTSSADYGHKNRPNGGSSEESEGFNLGPVKRFEEFWFLVL
jgi:hypothetical protein